MALEVESIRRVWMSGPIRWYILYRTKSGFWDEMTVEAETEDDARCRLVEVLRMAGEIA